jgi:uncharacterized lipoprotein YmbA
MMEKSRIIRTVCGTILTGVILLTACGRTPPAKFYTLQPVQQSPMGRSLPADVGLAVGPVEIPAAVDRTEIVTRDAGNEVSFSQYYRWAAPLRQSIASVIAQNIGTLLGTERVTPFTRENIFRPTHRVVININRYDSRLSKEFLIDATWSIKDLDGNKLLLIRNSIIREPLAASNYEGLVAAQSKALATLSEELAKAILNLAQKGQ